MAITTYAELQTAIASWANRSDLTALIPDFITLAEGRINTDLRLRTMEVDEALTGVVSSRFIALPTGFLQPLALWWNNGVAREDVRFIPASDMNADVAEGLPLYWTVDGTNIAFERPCDSAYSFTLRCSEKLDIASTINRLLLDTPLVYLAGALVEVFAYLQDPQAAGAWEQRYQQALSDARSLANRSRSLATLSVDAALVRPRRFNINTGE